MPLRRPRNHFNSSSNLNEVLLNGYEKSDLLSAKFQKDLAGMYPLCMIVGSSDQGMVLPQEDRVPRFHVALLRGKITVRLWCIMWLKFKLQLVSQ
ncbi:uncharacterized protein TNCV_4580221 [Trichonephila clavipes]|nr:uncharacterized protein TNCV_4580221 [Trichonephila clavipes]